MPRYKNKPTYVNVLVYRDERHGLWCARANCYSGRRCTNTLTLSRGTEAKCYTALNSHFRYLFGCDIGEIPHSVQTELI